jgi:phosphoglycerol transferase MdoB-like AlkP superfamily enzyme
MSPGFWGAWIIKIIAVIVSISVPMLIGMDYKKDSKVPHRSILFLLVLDLLIQLSTPVFSGQFIPSPELYLLKNSSGVFLSYLGILLVGPFIIKVIEKYPIQSLRRVLLIIFAIFVVGSMIFNQDIMGFSHGQNLIWYLYLFVIGYWIRSENWQSFSFPQALIIWFGSLIASFVSSWITINKVNYDPHHGMTLTTNYLGTISSSQPFFLITAVLGLIILIKSLKQPVHLKVSNVFTFGFVLILANNPKLIIFSLPFFSKLEPHVHTSLIFLMALLVSLVFVVLMEFVYGRLIVFNDKLKLFQNFKFDISHVDRYIKRIFTAWHFWLIIGIGWIMTVLSMSKLWDWDINMTQWIIIHREFIIFINIGILLAIFGIVWTLINRYWYALMITVAAYAIWLMASFIKIDFRAEPILPSDMSMITSVSELLDMVSTPLIIGAVVGIIILAVVAIFIQHHDKSKLHLNWKLRGTILLISLLSLGSFFTANHAATPVALLLADVQDKPYFFAQLRGAKLNGTLLQFANNVDVTVMDEPSGYSKAKMAELAKKYQLEADTINKHRSNSNMKKQTVIFNLSESFSDPARVPNLKVNGDPIPYIRQTKENNPSGLMLTSGYGGGTANIEYQTLTGMAINNFSPTLPTPYSQLVPYQKTAPAFTDLFDYKVGIHPFSANLYSRKAVYKKFGFDKFYHLVDGDKITYKNKIGKSPYISDESAYQQTLKVLNEHPGGQFINLVTMQNHMPFDDYYSKNDFSVTGTAYTDNSHKQQIENYTQGIHYTDQALKQFIAKIDQMDRPITLIWYGDHLPGLYNGNSLQKYGLTMHETDYFVYSNKYSRQQSNDLPKTKIVSPNNFSAMALYKMNMKVSPYYALQTKVYTDLPAMSLDSFNSSKNSAHGSDSEFVGENGKVINNLTKHQKQLMHDYELLQYDITAGKQYSLKNGMMDF